MSSEGSRQKRAWRALLVCAALAAGCGRTSREAPRAKVTIESAPEQGATVLIQGVERGQTPLTVDDLPPGWVDVLLKKDNYKRTADRIEVKPGQFQKFVITMDPRVGFLSLESEPSGAEIVFDGSVRPGATPLFRYPLSIGAHSYQLTLDNYYPVTSDLDVEEDFQYDFKYVLKPKEATLIVMSRPTGAAIRLNNQLQTKKTPAQFELDPGIYLVNVYSNGFIQEESKIELGPNQEESVTLVMKQGEVPEGMALVPGGDFIWGEDGRSPDETPRRKVFLEAFYIDKHEVTNAEFKSVFPAHTFVKGQELYPVAGVSWSQAMDYAAKAGKRLPTEAEWEKAARGDDGREFPWGADFSAELCNTKEARLDAPAAAGSFLGGVSPSGCMDMAGNVYEWTVNWYDRYPGNTVVVKDYGQIYRVLRGGSFSTSKFDARCARRHFDRMDARRADYGFRCARDVTVK